MSSGIRRDTILVTLCTLLSRITGFGRVVATAAVLGVGVLGDVYQTANMIPNLLFELVAGGVLQAVLVPSFVAARREGGNAALSEATQATAAVIVVGLDGRRRGRVRRSRRCSARLLLLAEPSASLARPQARPDGADGAGVRAAAGVLRRGDGDQRRAEREGPLCGGGAWRRRSTT